MPRSSRGPSVLARCACGTCPRDVPARRGRPGPAARLASGLVHEDVKDTPAPRTRPLSVVVAPDSFKGSATATQVAAALAAGARAALGG
ncbi:glycerate kinase, partial [Isoptericola sp. NPDC060257]|uniref:glycerate kinase n=1 Tax=Isoptericola sp. NPDC060257 TaxID=3347087 RepID=UPI0036482766